MVLGWGRQISRFELQIWGGQWVWILCNNKGLISRLHMITGFLLTGGQSQLLAASVTDTEVLLPLLVFSGCIPCPDGSSLQSLVQLIPVHGICFSFNPGTSQRVYCPWEKNFLHYFISLLVAHRYNGVAHLWVGFGSKLSHRLCRDKSIRLQFVIYSILYFGGWFSNWVNLKPT